MNFETIADKLSLWIKDKIVGAGCQGAVFGLSGGIDSAVIAVLCQRIMPGKTLGVIMPCYSAPVDEEHALMVAGKFAIPTKKVVLDGIFDGLLKLLPSETKNADTDRLAKANIKSRLRMITLYYFANQLNYMVVGSGDRSEIAMGYFTKYGDGGVDILPIGNLTKGQVQELGRYLGVPQEITDKPPTAGLWAGQTAEGEMGLLYTEIDRFILTGEAASQVKEKIKRRMAGAGHKCAMPPLAPI